MDKSISVIIPCYNEEKEIVATINEVILAFRDTKIRYEIIIINDCSTDNTKNIVLSLIDKIPNLKLVTNNKNSGFCRSYFVGVNNSEMKYCIYVPGDNDLKAKELRKILKVVGEAQVIVTSFKNIESRVVYRRIISKLYTSLINFITGNRFKYYNGFNVYQVADLKKIQLMTTGFSFQANMLLELARTNSSLKEVEINCAFNDAKSTAFRFKNIIQVLVFVSKVFLRYRLSFAI